MFPKSGCRGEGYCLKMFKFAYFPLDVHKCLGEGQGELSDLSSEYRMISKVLIMTAFINHKFYPIFCSGGF